MPHHLRRPRLARLGVTGPLVLTGLLAAAGLQSVDPGPAPTAAPATSTTPATRLTSLDVPVLPRAQRQDVAVETPVGRPDASGEQPTTTDTLPKLAAVAPRATKDYGLVGVTWRRGTGQEDVRVQVRTRSGSTWSGWSDLEVDPQSTGEDGTRAGTEPLWAGDADGVAVRVLAETGHAPQDVRTVLVDPGEPSGIRPAAATTSTSSPSRAATAAASAPAYTPMPKIISRASWGARGNSGCDSPRYGSTQLGVVFHHTAGTNSYSKAQSAGIVRAVQRYHMDGRGWCDIGYNFLVDKYGQIFEGRSGGVLNQVRGAHAGNASVNTYATGVSMMGNLDTAKPSAAMRAAATRLIGWRIGTFYIPAKGSYAIAGKTLQRISGHRDVYRAGIRPATSTACPGKYGYVFLTGKNGLRDSVARYVSRYRTAIKVKASQLGRSYTGNVYVGEHPVSGGWTTRFTRGDIAYKAGLGPRWIPSGPILTEYAAVGGTARTLKFPQGDVTTVGSRAFQRFQGGTIWRVGPTRALALIGEVDAKYRALGGLAGRLGAPVSRVQRSSTTDSATFTGGRITYDRGSKAYTVTYG